MGKLQANLDKDSQASDKKVKGCDVNVWMMLRWCSPV